VRNCKTYWHPKKPVRCTEDFYERRPRPYYFNYPGFFKKNSGVPVTAAIEFHDENDGGLVYKPGKVIPERLY